MFDADPNEVTITIRGDGRALTRYELASESEMEEEREWLGSPPQSAAAAPATTVWLFQLNHTARPEAEPVSLLSVLIAGLFGGAAAAAVTMILQHC